MKKEFGKLTIVVGKRATGKTTNLIRQSNKKKVSKKEKTLIFNPFDEDLESKNDYKNPIRSIFVKDIQNFNKQSKAEIVQIRPVLEDGSTMGTDYILKTVIFILKNYKKGNLIIEGTNSILPIKYYKSIISDLSILRHLEINVTLVYQSIESVVKNKKLLGLVSKIDLFYLNEDVALFNKIFLDKTEIISLAQCTLNHIKQNDRNLSIDLEEFKISGNFNKKTAQLGILSYLLSKNKPSSALILLTKKGYKNIDDCIVYLKSFLLKEYFNFNN